MLHTLKDAEHLLFFLRKTVSVDARLIGGLGAGKESDHDIDILLPNHKRTVRLRNKLMRLLDAKSHEATDWGGIYFKDTHFGNVDIFFTTKNFDYGIK